MQTDRLFRSQWWVLRVYLVLATLGLLFGAVWSYDLTADGTLRYTDMLRSAAGSDSVAVSELMFLSGAPALSFVGAIAAIVLFGLSIRPRRVAILGTMVFSATVITMSFIGLSVVADQPNADFARAFRFNVMPLAGLSGAVFVWLFVCAIVLSRKPPRYAWQNA